MGRGRKISSPGQGCDKLILDDILFSENTFPSPRVSINWLPKWNDNINSDECTESSLSLQVRLRYASFWFEVVVWNITWCYGHCLDISRRGVFGVFWVLAYEVWLSRWCSDT